MVQRLVSYQSVGGVLLLSCVVALASCSTTSLLKPYPTYINPVIAKVESSSIDASLSKVQKRCDTNDKALYLMEHGRIAQIGGKLDLSKESFRSAMDCFAKAEEKALVSATDVAATAGSIVTNDATIPYNAFPYEKVMVYQFQALNHLFSKDIENAAVNMRRANDEQKLLLARHEKEIAKTQVDLEKNKVDSNAILSQQYAGLNEIEGRVKNSFQNAYSYYAAGVIQEIYASRGTGGGAMEINNAYLDYKNALEIFPENTYLQQDVLRLAKKLGMNEDYEAFSKRFPEAQKLSEQSANEQDATLFVIYEDGLVPQMEDVKIPIPTPNGVLTVDFPIYPADQEPIVPLEVHSGETLLGNTALICDVRALAVKNLKERLPSLIVREVARTAVSAAGQQQLAQHGGGAGIALGSAIDFATSRADLRSFYTLPRFVQCFRGDMAPGKQQLRLRASTCANDCTLDLDVPAKGLIVVRVARVGSKAFLSSVQL